MIEEPVGREADTFRPVPLRRFLTLGAAIVFGAAAVVRLAGDPWSSVPAVIGTVLLTGLALVLVLGAVMVLTSRVTVDDTRVVQQVGTHRRSLPLSPGTDLTLHRELMGSATAKRVRWVLKLRREGSPPIDVDSSNAPDLVAVLDHVAAAGHRHPGLLADPTLRAVIADPTLLDASAAELQVAVDDVRRTD